jgi:hypothetical protein
LNERGGLAIFRATETQQRFKVKRLYGLTVQQSAKTKAAGGVSQAAQSRRQNEEGQACRRASLIERVFTSRFRIFVNPMQRLIAHGLFIWLIAGCATPTTRQVGFEFALIGDVPYNEFDATNSFPNMITEINRARLAFVVHDGDIKSGNTPCSDEAFQRCYEQLQTFKHPLIYIFGDNEWSDCKTNAYDPEERLQKLREIFTKGDQSLGQRPLGLERQSENSAYAAYRENVRWIYGGVLFAGFNVPGNANNYGKREFRPRNQANLAWLRENFAVAARENLHAIMLIIQANPHFDLARTNRLRAGFNDFIDALERETTQFTGQVVLVHGDSHYFRIDKPLMGTRSKRRLENFTRVETFGNPDVHWLRARVDWRDPNVFSFEQRIVKQNLVNHRGGAAATPAEVD